MQQLRTETAFSAFARSRDASALLGRLAEDALDEAEVEAPLVQERTSHAVDRRPRTQLQPPRPNMDWPDWAARTQRVQERLASTLEQLIWGGIGALVGTAAGAVPALFEGVRSGYPFVLFQPMGAALGAALALAILAMVRNGRKAEREALTPPSAWSTRPGRGH